MNTSAPLPTFRECSGDHKFIPLAERDIQDDPQPEVLAELTKLAALTGKSPRDMTVLDFGCGRGQLVGQLRRLGWRAFGIEVGEEFVAAGNPLLSRLYADDHPILSMVNADGSANFPSGFFDVVIADQVFEHVADLDKVAADVARLLKPGGVLLGMFPARFRLIEPHYRLPLVHWLPKGRLQDALIRTMVRGGLGVRPPKGISAETMASVVGTYAATETFYRPNREFAEIFGRHGIRLDFDTLIGARLNTKLERMTGLPRTILLALSRLLPLVRLYSLFQHCMARGVKTEGTSVAHHPQNTKPKPAKRPETEAAMES